MDSKALILHKGQNTYMTTMITAKMPENVFPEPCSAFICSSYTATHLQHSDDQFNMVLRRRKSQHFAVTADHQSDQREEESSNVGDEGELLNSPVGQLEDKARAEVIPGRNLSASSVKAVEKEGFHIVFIFNSVCKEIFG